MEVVGDEVVVVVELAVGVVSQASLAVGTKLEEHTAVAQEMC